MSKPARGTKRVCGSCGARFYDLGRSPITCPVCQAVFHVAAPARRGASAPAPAAKPEAETEEESKPVMAGAEVISLDEAEEAEEAAADDEEIVDIGDDDEDIPDSDDEDAFLEDDEEEDTDVSGIVKGDREDEA
ncbi:MAG: TIGR02300 family protein [Methyloceanibacter sp.]|nr:TIGR02300 family protein [Methyloceanibacter sp.]